MSRDYSSSRSFRIESELWVTPEMYDKYLLSKILDTEKSTIRYQETVLSIERRWDALMKRRSEPKRATWKVDALGGMHNN